MVETRHGMNTGGVDTSRAAKRAESHMPERNTPNSLPEVQPNMPPLPEIPENQNKGFL